MSDNYRKPSDEELEKLMAEAMYRMARSGVSEVAQEMEKQAYEAYWNSLLYGESSVHTAWDPTRDKLTCRTVRPRIERDTDALRGILSLEEQLEQLEEGARVTRLRATLAAEGDE